MMKSWLAGLFCLGIAVPVVSLANQDPATSMQSSVDDFREFSRVMQERRVRLESGPLLRGNRAADRDAPGFRDPGGPREAPSRSDRPSRDPR